MSWGASAVLWAVSTLRSSATGLENAFRRARDDHQRRQLENAREFRFYDDYTTSQETVWALHLKDFVGKPAVHLLEVGAYEGRSTLWFLQNVLTHPTATATCIDSFGRIGGEIHFDHNMRLSGAADRVSKLKGLSIDLLPTLEGRTFDIIYIDGSHHAVDVLMDAFLCWPLLKPRGVMIFDDYLWELHRPPSRRPQMAINLFLNTMGGAARVVHRDYQIIVTHT